MKGLNLVKRVFAAIPFEHAQTSYSQAGEDRILQFLFSLLDIPTPTYLDIGAHDPTYLSNTYLFYKQGSKGVCVEPDPELHRCIQQKRPRDTCLNIGIAVEHVSNLEFYVFDEPSMNTFSQKFRDEQISVGRVLKKTLQVPVCNVNEVIARHFSAAPDLVSLDTEGMDLSILKSFDFSQHRPVALCVETLGNPVERKLTEIIDFMVGNRYRIYSDTYINTIFVNEDIWQTRFILSQVRD